MTNINPLHTLTVIEVDGVLRYKIDCDGVTDACRMWQECLVEGCDQAVLDREEEDGGDEPVLHGMPHRRLDDGWSTPTGLCFLPLADAWPERAVELGLTPGEYRVRHVLEVDGGDYVLAVVGNPGTVEPSGFRGVEDAARIALTGRLVGLTHHTTRAGRGWADGVFECLDGAVPVEVPPIAYGQLAELSDGNTVAVTGLVDRRPDVPLLSVRAVSR